MHRFSDARIVESWRKNAGPWTEAVRGGQIESRKLVTNQAVVDAILSRAPRSVLDIGCGEGWLARALAEKAIRVTGVDVVPELIERAQRAGGGEFRVESYENIMAGRLSICVDAAVCNFSLLGKESVDGVFAAVPAMLDHDGSFIVQTLHPVAGCGDLPYQDGWRTGSWDGFNADFVDPAPWYFRTLESWKRLFSASGMNLIEIREPILPHTQRPASVIFIAKRSRDDRR
jgi:2-polyprenyl-3-methyl-5-hydroxy-6-metoxy-1,4-benzoquinol methylase